MAEVSLTWKTWCVAPDKLLLVFDDIGGSEILRDWLSDEGGAHVLCTMGSKFVADIIGKEHSFEVKPFGLDETREFVMRNLGNEGSEEQDGSIRKIVSLLGGLPIAVQQSVALAKTQHIPLHVLVMRLEKDTCKREVLGENVSPNVLHEDRPPLQGYFRGIGQTKSRGDGTLEALVCFDTRTVEMDLLAEGGSQLKGWLKREKQFYNHFH